MLIRTNYLVVRPFDIISLIDEHDLVLVFVDGGSEHVWNCLVRPLHINALEQDRKPSVHHSGSEIMEIVYYKQRHCRQSPCRTRGLVHWGKFEIGVLTDYFPRGRHSTLSEHGLTTVPL